MRKEDKKLITDRIKFLRNKHKITQDKMAEKVGLEYGSYVQMENGANLPSLPVLIKLSEIFEVSLDAIVFGNDDRFKNDEQVLYDFVGLFNPEQISNSISTLEDLLTLMNKYNKRDK